MQRPAKPFTPVQFRPPPPNFKKAPRALFFIARRFRFKLAQCPSGEIGRHSGLKIRRLPEKGRTGSIPVSGTNPSFYTVRLELRAVGLALLLAFTHSHPFQDDSLNQCLKFGIHYSSRCPSRSPRSPTRTRRWSMTSCSAPPRRPYGRSLPIPNTSVPRSGSSPACIPGDITCCITPIYIAWFPAAA
jgi:hypothetical protein